MSFDALPVHLDTVLSTNSWMHENLHLSSGSVVYSLNQTKGRGRLGRNWIGSQGDSLAVSLLVDALEPHIPLTWLPLLAGVAARETLAKAGLEDVQLKWPNDLLVGGEKLAGILVEGTADGRAVVGWGINLRNPPVLHGEGRATSLRDHEIEIGDVVAQLVDPWRNRIRTLCVAQDGLAQTPIETWKELYLTHLSTLGRKVRIKNHENEVFGVAAGISDDGGLVVEREGSPETQVIYAGDVFHIERS